MKKLILLFAVIFAFSSCEQSKEDIILPTATGTINEILVVIKGNDWEGKVGDELRTVFGEHQVGLPQPETILSVTQVDPTGFASFMRNSKSILVLEKGAKESFSITENKYSKPQVVMFITAKDEAGFINVIQQKGKEIIKTFQALDIKKMQRHFAKNKLDDSKYKTTKNLGLSLTIPKIFKTVDDTGEFLWLRQHLKSGIARGDGSNNILIYSLPLEDEATVAENVTKMRDSIGEKYIPGSDEGMYMITEQAYAPFTFDAEIDGKKAYETRGKWEVKNDFMAGPFINYTIVDKKNNRLIVFEGFTYAPSVNKRDFIFELEAIGKSLKIK
ncbi:MULTISPECIES: DUF4837 family protein [Tenacibaculum]|uniref:DUF4837 family protein n=1 Tax=Tenacibaculum TaxID=104267 RepID=UPI001F0B5F98|nr:MULTISPECIES: DUF4837 family protein [Tenacibaculum]MCH3881287.1 DUF4837 family protein [Tenacibaculum aquimarinum]MDO6599119.1 DUF4837 family protein [Tenacibaculum sp. 1_MG-2023]